MRSFPRSRIDALTDGIFAFAMTLLVLELRLPDLPVKDSAALIADLAALWPKYLAYLISFFVLAAHWRSCVELRRVETVSPQAMSWWMLYLFFVTSIPFSTNVVGLHGDLAPAEWLYAANLIAVSALSLRLRVLEVAPEHRRAARAGHVRIVFVTATAVLSVLVSFVAPGHAMFVYLLNVLVVKFKHLSPQQVHISRGNLAVGPVPNVRFRPLAGPLVAHWQRDEAQMDNA